MRRAFVAASLVAALAVTPVAGGGLRLKGVDASAYPTVRGTVVATSPFTKAPVLTEDGRPVAGLRAENLGRQKYVVLGIDVSRSMAGQALADARSAARGFVRAKPAADRLALVVFGNTATQLTDFSSARIDADAALRELELAPLQGTALYDAVVVSAKALASQPLPGRVLILLTDGADQGSDTGLQAAVKAVRDAGVVVYPIGIVSEQFSAAPLERLAKESGGTYYPAASTSSLASIYSKIAAELGRTWRLEYVTAARPGDTLHLSAKVAGVGTATSGITLPGSDLTVKSEKPSPLLPEHLYSSSAGTLFVAGVVGFLALLAVGIALAVRKGTRLRNRIEAHVSPTVSTDGKKLRPRERFGAAAGLFRATENAFGHLNAWRKLQRTIERADLPLRTVEFVYIAFGTSLLFGLIAAVAAAGTPVILVGFVIGFTLPLGFLWFKAKRRLTTFENQLPDLLITMAASLKAGHSFRQGIQTIVDEGQAPASDEFKRVLTETRLGRPMDDALNEMAERVGSKNLEFVITCVTIQRQVGGSLAGLFDMVAEAVRSRQQFARKIRSLTAMGRMSAYTLCGLPFFVAGVLTVMNGEYMSPLYNTGTGNLLIAVGLCMMAVGSLFLKKIVSFKG